MAKSLLGKLVEITFDQINPAGKVVLQAGMQGRVVWDEPGGDIVVEFEQEVPLANNGRLPDQRQAWVMRQAVVTD